MSLESKPIVKVCSGYVDRYGVARVCDEIIDDAGLSFNDRDEVEAWAYLELIDISHGICKRCYAVMSWYIDDHDGKVIVDH